MDRDRYRRTAFFRLIFNPFPSTRNWRGIAPKHFSSSCDLIIISPVFLIGINIFAAENSLHNQFPDRRWRGAGYGRVAPLLRGLSRSL